MDFISQLPNYVSLIFTSVLPFLIVLTIVVFFHELGHFMVARYYDVKVTDFSIGFGKEIYGFYDKHGTRWRFAWLPLGGYVKFVDDDNAASVPDAEASSKLSQDDQKGSFHVKPLAHRAAVVAAGPIANFILAIVIFAGIYTLVGESISEPRIGAVIADSGAEKAGFKEGDLVKSIDGKAIESFSDMQRLVSLNTNTELSFAIDRNDREIILPFTPRKQEITDTFGNKVDIALLQVQRFIEPSIGAVVAGSIADKAGFKDSDRILKIDDTPIHSFNTMQRIVSQSPGKKLSFLVLRDRKDVVLSVTPAAVEVTDRSGNKKTIGRLGVQSPQGRLKKKYNPVSAVWKGAKETYFIVDQTLSYLGKIIVGRESADQLGGPIRIAQISSQAASVGILPLVNLIAVLSVSIGLINLFPIPMLDGGHLLFYAFEAIKGKPLSEKTREYSFRIGLALVLMLMIFATLNDLIHIKVL
ncbi:MAG: RIP metalloprotease RseP [bacterium]|nr:RIP metalloprotease RseP [bacterium]